MTPCLILVSLSLLLCQFAFAQPICGFDRANAKMMKENPSYRTNVLNGESAIRAYLQQQAIVRPLPRTFITTTPASTTPSTTPSSSSSTTPSSSSSTTPPSSSSTTPSISPNTPITLGTALYTIPVAVHVIHTGGPVGSIYNPADAQIKGALDYLNAVYNGSYPGTQGVGDLQIQFVLAQRDPNCNPTNGINRVDGSGIAGYSSGGVNASTTLGTNEINVKNLSRWDPTQYYNIWIVDKIDGNDGTSGQFIAGFAYFPGAPASLDGIIMLATQMVTGQKTLPHEIGHAFNLYHPFEGSTGNAVCPANTNCTTQGDQVCDTDPITYNYNSGTGVIDFSCRSGTNTCTGTPYSSNTESNYMNYTNCYTLFTAGQKARMLASAAGPFRSGLSTSPGGTPPSGGGTACPPKIDFELTGDQETETTAATSGCRSYKDYSYNMVIGVGPSATATVTLNVSSGTAVQGIDFDITTNGSFTAPSQQLAFPAGSTASRPFTIRVYDDASVNGTRNVTLNFTVNNGGGNAAAGDGRPNFTLTINDNDTAPYGPANVTASVGPDQGAIQSPFAAANPKEKSQLLYYAAELTASGVKAGNITGLSLNIGKASAAGFPYQGMTIKMGLTSQTSLYDGSTQFPLNDAGFTTVYSSSTATTNGWNSFIFSTPFTWNGTSNIVVEICYDNGVSTSSTDQCEGYVDGSNATTYIFSKVNCGTAISTFNYFSEGVKPMIRFNYADPGTAVQTVLNSSQTQELGPNADIYFYDQASSKLMARIRNLSSFDYGCTQVVIDRAGTNATPFWNNNIPNYLMDKTFHILPAANNPSGNYTATFYYTQAEVDGWQAFTGQSIGNIQLVKVPAQISNVTPANPSGGGTVSVVTPSIGTLGTNTALTYTFTNGFSGFGAGVPALSTLPVGLINFEGLSEDNHAALTWTTSFEAGSKGFGIDRSFDGINFSQVGYVAAAGNSSLPRNYSFTDPALMQPDNYYRLRQIDLNDKIVYSKVVLLKDARSLNAAFTVFPNPFTEEGNLDIVFGQIPVGKVQLRLLDVAGRELLRQSATYSGNKRIHFALPASSLTAGVYFLEVRFNNTVQVQRLIKRSL